MSRAIERLERRAQLGRQQLRLFPRRETPRETRQYDGNALVGVGPGVKVLWLNRLVCPARAVATHASRQKKGPAKRVPRSAGFAICSPRGIGEPHDIAPRGSVHLSSVAICLRLGRPQERAAPIYVGG